MCALALMNVPACSVLPHKAGIRDRLSPEHVRCSNINNISQYFLMKLSFLELIGKHRQNS